MSITLHPTPSPEGVAELQAYYRVHCQMEVDVATAFAVLSGIMRFLYLTEVKPPLGLHDGTNATPVAGQPVTSSPADTLQNQT